MSEEFKVNAEIEALKQRMDNTDRRFDKIDANIQKIWERIDLHRESSLKTQFLVETLRKDMTDSQMNTTRLLDRMDEKLDGLNEKMVADKTIASTKWEQFWSKGFWYLLGIAGTIATTMMLVKMGAK